MTDKIFTDKLIKELIFDYLEEQDDWFKLPVKEKKKLFNLYETIIQSVQQAINHPDTQPIIYAKDGKSRMVICKAISNLRSIVPEVDRVYVGIVN